METEHFNCKTNYCLYKKQVPANIVGTGDEQEIDLEIECTDLEGSEESNVRRYLLHKAKRNLISHNGQIGVLPNNLDTNQGTNLCYFALLPLSNQTVEDYIICIICEVDGDEGFGLFHNDLDRFSEKLLVLLKEVKKGSLSQEVLQDYLKGWYTYTIEYITRCIDLLKDNLPFLLYAVLIGKKITVLSQHPTILEDINKFVAASTLTNLSEANWKNDQELIISLDAQYTLQVNSQDTNLFCQEWAKALTMANNPFQTRSLMDHYKLKVVEEVNQLRRFLEAAKMNNYAMYKAYLFLKRNSNTNILMNFLVQEAKQEQHSSEVLGVIQYCLQ